MTTPKSFPRRALVSVSDKTGLGPFVQELAKLGFEIISTGGTRKFIADLGVPVIDIATYTGFPEIMDGRVKTLHPKVHGAILGRPDLPEDAKSIQEHGIVPFEVVVCNLYPFEATIAKPDVTIADAIENIDIGGPSMIRSSAKNHKYVAVVTRADQYPSVIEALKAGGNNESFRRELAAAAFEMTAKYDRAIANYMAKITAKSDSATADAFPAELSLRFQKTSTLRYGENPHQTAAFYVEPDAAAASLAKSKILHGKELSYNNLLDLDSAYAIGREFGEPTAVVIKHNNPCGCAIGATLAEAFDKAYAGDPVSAFGSVLAFNRKVDLATAEKLCEPNRFVEAIIAPGYEPAAFEALTTKPKWKNSVRLLECPAFSDDRPHGLDYRRVTGGMLVQDRDESDDPESEWKVVTKRVPSAKELADLKFGWKVCRHVKSNAIVYVNGGMVVGCGAGQMSRLDSAWIAARKAGDRSKGGVCASDAFFPFRDGVDEAAKAGITAVIQPGGSKRDEDTIAACNEHSMAIIFTGRRHLKH